MSRQGARKTAGTAHAEARVAELEAELAASQALLHEVDHRFKNDLQLITSVLLLHSRRAPDDAARDLLRAELERVSAVGAVHKRLNRGGDPKHIEADELIRDLAGEMAAGARRDDLQFSLGLEPVSLPARQAAPLALLLNELVRNALRHAFPQRPGTIAIGLRRAPGAAVLTVSDDGVGLAPPQARHVGFGSTLMQLLAQQLGGQLLVEDAGPGVRATLRIPEAALSRQRTDSVG
jgi:two-component sensor histidine kinase